MYLLRRDLLNPRRFSQDRGLLCRRALAMRTPTLRREALLPMRWTLRPRRLAIFLLPFLVVLLVPPYRFAPAFLAAFDFLCFLAGFPVTTAASPPAEYAASVWDIFDGRVMMSIPSALRPYFALPLRSADQSLEDDLRSPLRLRPLSRPVILTLLERLR